MSRKPVKSSSTSLHNADWEQGYLDGYKIAIGQLKPQLERLNKNLQLAFGVVADMEKAVKEGHHQKPS